MKTNKDRKRAGLKRKNTRVDFTPMVDMTMLLLTFFIFCSTLIKPQVMELVMPVPTEDPELYGPTARQSQAITFILASQDKVYYYEGLPNYEDYSSLKEISYEEVREVLAKKNAHIMEQVKKERNKMDVNEISKEMFVEISRDIRRDIAGTIAIIKPTEESLYYNLVDVLDEMRLCSIGRYAVVDMTENDSFLVENLESKGLYAQQNSMK